MSESKNLQKAESVKIVYKTCTQRCSTSYKITPEELEALNTLRVQTRIPFNSSNPSHISLLSQFWQLVFPSDEIPEDLKSPKWKEIGFQGKDPSTDFRGAGVFGLSQLIYLSTTYPAEFKEILSNSSTYCFAISALNITHMLMCFFQLHKLKAVGITGGKILDVQKLKSFCALNLQSLDIINEIFCGGVFKMHQKWLKMNKKNNLTLMQFQPAILEAGEFIEEVLENDISSVLQLKSLLFVKPSN